MTGYLVSNCCGTGFTVAGDTTQYRVCDSCGEPCDAVTLGAPAATETRWWKCYCGEVVTEPHRDCDGGVPWDRENDRRVNCRTCWDTGQVWAPEADGTGMYDSACPDCDAPSPVSSGTDTTKENR